MLKKNTVKRTKVCAQSPVNALSNRNHHLNEAPNNSILSQYHSTPIEYTLDLRTNFKPPTKLTVKKTPECQISLANAKENLASTETQNENNHLSLVLRKPEMKAESKSPLNLKYSSSKSRSALENSAIKKEECQEDEEITQKMLEIQNELNKLSLYEPRSPTSLTKHGQNVKFVEIVGRLKEIITQLQAKDRLQRKEIAILKKNNEDLKNDLTKFEQNSNDTEKIKEITALFPTKYGSYPAKEKRNSRTEKQRLEEKAHTYAKSALSSPSHKTFDLHDRKKKFLGNELSRERSSKDEKLNSVNLSYSVNNETLVAKTHQTSISNLHLPNQSRSNNLFYTSTPAQETTQKDLASNQVTELDSLVQLRVVTMSDIENSDEGTCSSHKATSHQNITSLQDIYNTRDTRMFPPTEQFQSLTQREHLKSTREQVVSHRLNLSHQNSPNSSSIISFPNTSFVPSKARRDEIRDKSNEKEGARSHSQPINDRHNGNVPTAKETSNLDGNLSPTASEVMIRYKQYLNEPHVSPLQCESKSINKDFGWHYLTTVSKNGEDTKNLSINTINNFTRNEIKLPTLTDELSKIIIPEELASEELKRENSYDDKVTLFNRCLKLTMGLGSSVLDENQPSKNINQKNLISMENIVLSPNLSNIKRPFCLGIAARK